jgi:hypothetical protein
MMRRNLLNENKRAARRKEQLMDELSFLIAEHMRRSGSVSNEDLLNEISMQDIKDKARKVAVGLALGAATLGAPTAAGAQTGGKPDIEMQADSATMQEVGTTFKKLVGTEMVEILHPLFTIHKLDPQSGVDRSKFLQLIKSKAFATLSSGSITLELPRHLDPTEGAYGGQYYASQTGRAAERMFITIKFNLTSASQDEKYTFKLSSPEFTEFKSITSYNNTDLGRFISQILAEYMAEVKAQIVLQSLKIKKGSPKKTYKGDKLNLPTVMQDFIDHLRRNKHRLDVSDVISRFNETPQDIDVELTGTGFTERRARQILKDMFLQHYNISNITDTMKRVQAHLATGHDMEDVIDYVIQDLKNTNNVIFDKEY